MTHKLAAAVEPGGVKAAAAFYANDRVREYAIDRVLTMTRSRLKPLRPGRTEAQVLSAVLDALACYGVDAIHRNTGGGINLGGQYVPFGRPGDPDISETLPASFAQAAGKTIALEVKAEGWRPPRPGTRARAHWDCQLERLQATCEAGGYGFWVNDASQVVHVLGRIREGWHITWEGDYPVLESPDDPTS
jgi:hypothetical protein